MYCFGKSTARRQRYSRYGFRIAIRTRQLFSHIIPRQRWYHLLVFGPLEYVAILSHPFISTSMAIKFLSQKFVIPFLKTDGGGGVLGIGDGGGIGGVLKFYYVPVISRVADLIRLYTDAYDCGTAPINLPIACKRMTPVVDTRYVHWLDWCINKAAA